MPKAATTKTTKAKEPKEPKEAKEKTPSPYQLFMKEQLPVYKSKNPEVTHKDAFRAVALLWKDADENPNKGQAAKPRAPAKPKEKVVKEKPKKKPTKKAAAAVSSDAEDKDDGVSSDAEKEAADDDGSD
ncbi:YABBY protein [Ceratobasidium theobromae]|uniref:YABBY protein n=1 Tax=Ceratobasidium theobromae TaxID=1582974 RepID=A0A5N5QQJ2_9AGAM|nr:YABBY protein [Ceratobasidium theobromae]